MKALSAQPDRTLVAVLVVIGLLVVGSLAVVFAGGAPREFDAATPQGVVQRYAAAVIDGDDEAAAQYLATKDTDRCQGFERQFAGNLRVSLVSVREREDSADVRVTIATLNDGGPFGASEYENQDVFDLVKVDGAWLVETAPWQFTICPDKGPAP